MHVKCQVSVIQGEECDHGVEHGEVMLAVVFFINCNNCGVFFSFWLIINCHCGAGLFLCGKNGHLKVALRGSLDHDLAEGR